MGREPSLQRTPRLLKDGHKVFLATARNLVNVPWWQAATAQRFGLPVVSFLWPLSLPGFLFRSTLGQTGAERGLH